MYQADDSRYDKMSYKRCGNSGILLPRVSLGMWQNFGTEKPLTEQKEIIFRAFDLGITHFDLANNYGAPNIGMAEENFGKIFEEDLKLYREQILVSTKAGYDFWPGPYGNWGSRKYLMSSLDASLKRMKLDYVDIFYHHRFDPDTPLEETMRTLADIVHQGKALYVGISNYSAEQTAQAADLLATFGVPLTIHQPRYNMLDRWIERGTPSLCDVLLNRAIGAAVFSPLNQGLLTDRYLHGIPADSRAASSCVFLNECNVTADVLTRVRALNAMASARGETMAQLALAWVLENPAITTVITGASRPAQILQNVETLRKHVPLSDEEKAAIEKILG